MTCTEDMRSVVPGGGGQDIRFTSEPEHTGSEKPHVSHTMLRP